MTKPNPVKKTIEYCYYNHNEKCGKYRMGGYCERYDHDLLSVLLSDSFGTPEPAERPKWCTDETFVRVKIEPVVVEGRECCISGDGRCTALVKTIKCNYFCMVLREDRGKPCASWERPERCRKLEVE